MQKVIIVILTYNLEQYIVEALESVLKQKTSYDYKILIGDDCSTDNTPEILKQYQEKYPDKIEIKYSDKNLGCLGNSNRMFDGLQSEYFTLLDGDDVWLDDYHLQKQIDFLENHKEYIAVAGNTQHLRNGKPDDLIISKDCLDKTFTFEDLVNGNAPYYHPSATMFRNVIYSKGLPQCYKDAVDTFENCALRGDDFRRIQHLQEGPVYIMPELLSYYRIHEGSIWAGNSEDKRIIESTIAYNFYRKYYHDTPYFESFNNTFAFFYSVMMKHLVSSRKLINTYTLNEKCTSLFTALLQDLSKQKIPFNTDKKYYCIEKESNWSLIKLIIKKIFRTIFRHN